MKIAFVPQNCIPFHGRTLDERPLGGIETATIRLSAALDQLGAEVKVFTPIENPPLSAPLYLPYRAIDDLGPCDALIAVRDWQGALLPLKAKKRLFWTGDSYDQPQTIGIGDQRVVQAIDYLCPVSDWHAATLSQHSGFPTEKIHVLRNGVQLEYFSGSETRNWKRLIYSSTPYRGLKFVPNIYRELKKLHPDLELHVFSGFGVYSGSPLPQAALREYETLKFELETLPGCVVHGNVKQDQLAREFMRAGILLYPNTFEETSCISAMEAQAGGCVVLTCNRAALKETIGDCGVFVEPQSDEAAFVRSFIDAAHSLLADEDRLKKLSAMSHQRSEQHSWKHIAEGFLSFLQNLVQ